MTDGEQTKRGKWTPLGLASSYLKKKGVRIYSMGIGTRVSRTELNEMSSHPERNVFIATSFKVLESKVNEIINRVCYPGRSVSSCYKVLIWRGLKIPA